MALTYNQLSSFNQTISQMQAAQLDVTAMTKQYQSDIAAFNGASTATAFQQLDNLIQAQYQEAVVDSISALPYIGAARLNDFQQQINLLKTYGLDSSSYQQQYKADKAALSSAKTLQAYESFVQNVNAQ